MNNSNQIYRSRINSVIDYINANLDKSFSLEELAEIAHFSSFHFHRIFLAITGETVNAYTNRVRLEKASRLLKFSRKLTVADIAYGCGFSSPATFSRSFKTYFEMTPSTYRRKGKTENSKIRKALPPIAPYLVSMSEEEKKKEFKVVVKKQPEQKVAYIRVNDSFKDGVVIKTFEKIVAWAKKVKLYDTENFFGMSLDDPMITPTDKYRYEVCMTVPNDFQLKADDPVNIMTLPKMNLATTVVSGKFEFVATAIHYLFNDWLVNSEYEPAHQYGFEIFRDKKNISNWEYLHMELCVPVAPLKMS